VDNTFPSREAYEIQQMEGKVMYACQGKDYLVTGGLHWQH
jgi:hypothetical protein